MLDNQSASKNPFLKPSAMDNMQSWDGLWFQGLSIFLHQSSMCMPSGSPVNLVNALAESPESGLARWIDASMQARSCGSLGILRTASRRYRGCHLQTLDIIILHINSLYIYNYIYNYMYRFAEIVVQFCARLSFCFFLNPCIWFHLVHEFLSPNLKPDLRLEALNMHVGMLIVLIHVILLFRTFQDVKAGCTNAECNTPGMRYCTYTCCQRSEWSQDPSRNAHATRCYEMLRDATRCYKYEASKDPRK